MKLLNTIRLPAVAIAMALLAGCATTSAPRPSPDAPPDAPGVQAIAAAGDAGLLCAAIPMQGDPEDVRKAVLAVDAALEVLQEPVPSLSKVSAALSEGMPQRYAGFSSMVVVRVRKRLGDADVLQVDTVGYGMIEEFLVTCKGAIGSTAAADLLWINETLGRLAG